MNEPELTTSERPAPAGVLEHGGARLFPSHPVRVDVPADASRVELARVAAVVPCFNRAGDLWALLRSMAELDTGGIDLRVLVVDNCSDEPLEKEPVPAEMCVEFLRLSRNLGGSGGYNAGMERVLGLDDSNPNGSWTRFAPEWVWLVDSDATVDRNSLGALLDVVRAESDIVAAGPAICDPKTGVPFEVGGVVNRTDGIFEPAVDGAAGLGTLVECEYVAACCALVRADAVRCCGVMPDTFLNGDDVEWMIRMGQKTGGRIVGVPWARACHPRFDRFPTWTRYYTTRNAHGPLRAIGASRSARLRRGMRDVLRAMQQEMMGRGDLARLHLRGLQDAASGATTGVAPAGRIEYESGRPISRLLEEIGRQVGEVGRLNIGVHPAAGLSTADRHALALAVAGKNGALIDLEPQRGMAGGLWRAAARAAWKKRLDVAIVPARGRPDSWARARWHVQIAGEQFTLARSRPVRSAMGALTTGVRGARAAMRAARSDGRGPEETDVGYRAGLSHAGEELSVEAVILSHNRWGSLEHTVERLLDGACFGPNGSDRRAARKIMIVDNHSTDGTLARIEATLAPRGVGVLSLASNLGVDAFNQGVVRSECDLVLILDDDAAPDDEALRVAIAEMARKPDLGAVVLHPKHPRTRLSEWAFAARFEGRSTDAWPVMGCANLVRRSAWAAVGGYEPRFFLYRNDADLALKLLSAGYGVHFNPALVAWHDTPSGAGAAKSVRWHELATRNWIWMARRHGEGLPRVLGAVLGWVWAHRLAGVSVRRHIATLKGAMAGMWQAAPDTGMGTGGGAAWRSLLRLRLGRDI